MFDDNDAVDLIDRYYDRYKFSVAGYGIYLDKDLNVDYAYTTETHTSDNRIEVTHHDFKDAIDNDIIK